MWSETSLCAVGNLIVLAAKNYNHTALMLRLIWGCSWRLEIWAVTCDFQQCSFLTSVDSGEPVQPTFKLKNFNWLNTERIFKRLAKALIRLRVCAGWPEALLVSHTTLLEISCRSSITVVFSYVAAHFFVFTFILGESQLTSDSG